MATKILKYRLYPSPAQHTAMQGVLDACRWVYNRTLEIRQKAWDDHQESLSLYDTNKELTQWKKDHPWLKQAYSHCLQEAQERVDLAFQHFFRRTRHGEKPGYPRFKGRWYKSFTFKQPWSGFKFVDDKHLHLSKIGNVKIVLHRPIEGNIKRLVIKRDALGNWWACFIIGFEPQPLPPTGDIVGIDLGCEYFATLSTGEHISNPRFFRQDEKDLARAQRRLSKTEKGTTQYDKRKRVVQHIYNRITNRRKNFAHQLSRQLVNKYQVIVFENLDINGMRSKNWHGLNKSITDAAWGQLIRLTCEKAEWATRIVITVDPRNTSQMCSGCGELVPKDLSERIHICPYCGLELDRDINAAKNILALGLQNMGSIPKSSLPR
jgi:putative transposase